jgi:prolipoprotein diacylglyceryl transferase
VPIFTWNVDPILVRLGPIALRYYSLIFVLVFLGGYWLLKWQIERGGGDEEDAGDFIVYGVLGVLLGSRLGHVLFYDLDKALKDPLWVLRIWEGGLASHGAVVGLILAMWLFTRRRGIPFLEGADRFAFSAALGATLVRIGNFFNSEIVGKLTDQSWGVRLPRFDREPTPPLRHPTQLYEAALGIAVLAILYFADKRLGKEQRPRGALISIFFIFYFTGRFFVEFYKEHQTHEPTPMLTMGQWLSIPGFLIGVWGLSWSFKARLPASWNPDYGDEEDEDEEVEEGDEDDEDAPKKKKSKLYDEDVAEEFESKEKPADDDEEDEELDEEESDEEESDEEESDEEESDEEESDEEESDEEESKQASSKSAKDDADDEDDEDDEDEASDDEDEESDDEDDEDDEDEPPAKKK